MELTPKFSYPRSVLIPLTENQYCDVSRETKLPSGVCNLTQTVCEGVVPAWRDERGLPVIYETEREAQKEIAEMIIEHPQQFITGEREFEDAITTEDFILPIDVWPDGSISTENGLRFGQIEQ